ILVFHQGEVVESGTQPELIERGGRFAAMWADQVSSMNETRALPDTAGQDGPGVPDFSVDAPFNQKANASPVGLDHGTSPTDSTSGR
ncbi:unnamed protein product, partial [Rhizoctonia solani]